MKRRISRKMVTETIPAMVEYEYSEGSGEKLVRVVMVRAIAAMYRHGKDNQDCAIELLNEPVDAGLVHVRFSIEEVWNCLCNGHEFTKDVPQ